MERVYMGLDVGSSRCHVVALNQKGERIVDRGLATTEAELTAVIGEVPGEVHVHLEAGSMAGWVRRILKPRVAGIVVGHARTSAWIAKDRLKNDRLDAFKLADLLRMGRVHPVYYPDDEDRAIFKQLVQHYDRVTQQQAQLKVQIKARLLSHGIMAKGATPFSESGQSECLARVPSESARESIRQMYALLAHMVQAQREAFGLMRRHSRKYPEIAHLDTAPGVGPIGACRFSAYVQTPDRFGSKRKLWRYCRLGITDRSSNGTPLGRKTLDRNGVGTLKDLSRKAFHGALRTRGDNLFKRTYQAALRRTHNAVHARLTTQRKILSVLRALWKGDTDYRDLMG